MDVRTGGTIIAHRAETGNAPFAALDATALAVVFHAWRGASGRRYAATVYTVDLSADGCGLPAFDAFVLVPVRRDGLRYLPLAVLAVERESDKRFAIADALARGVDQWHVHLLATDRRARATVVADLAARHATAAEVALSA